MLDSTGSRKVYVGTPMDSTGLTSAKKFWNHFQVRRALHLVVEIGKACRLQASKEYKKRARDTNKAANQKRMCETLYRMIKKAFT
jgi:hypothetical protein